MNKGIEQLKAIKTFPSLVRYLRDELDWQIESDDFEDLTYDYEAEELGIDAKTAAKIKDIKQLRPLVTNQPWGIFFINFEPKRLPIVALRRILRSLVIKKRASANRTERATWQAHDLLFISSYGESNEREISFAHFSENEAKGDLPMLKVLGWDAQNTILRLEDTHRTLKEKLRWPKDETDFESWRKVWASAFTLTYRYSIKTSKELSIELAKLASVIRARVNDVLAVESERGQLRQLYKAFQEALIHDLSEDDFADMYAQTIAYGLLSARVSRESGALVAENVADMVPVTNPFLKELMQTFLTVGGRKNKIDFDELGINEVVELLRQANMESVLKDFGDRNPNEDPVIHFYELFLKEYDPQKRMKRGVFYTPKPVVSFIVRSVDEILRTEFGLEDGLADTTTWGEMQQRHEGLQIPKGVRSDAPFVQILDPATGTGTFLVEAIDVIYRTMRDKWSREGKSESAMRELWNDYVPRHLLTRLHGFELMMAPYAIAHMKIGLKLAETKYAFLSSERARIYLTNTLEEPKDFSDYFEQMAPALAHEASAANKVKRNAPITVVIGNPPYSKSSGNRGNYAESLVQEYKDAVAGERNVQPLSDDYIKFLAYAKGIVSSRIGIIGFITNRSYLEGVIHRGMRNSLLSTFTDLSLVDLHGDSNVGEAVPLGKKNENVFDIMQGVAISLLTLGFTFPSSRLRYAESWGSRDEKYAYLLNQNLSNTVWQFPKSTAPQYFFIPKDFSFDDEIKPLWPIDTIFLNSGMGLKTRRDHFLLSIDKKTLIKKIELLAQAKNVEHVRPELKVIDNEQWTLKAMQSLVLREGVERSIHLIAYRPFDFRFVWYHREAIERGDSRWPVMRHVIRGGLSLLTSRLSMSERFTSAFVVRGLSEMKCAESTRGSHTFPLYLVNHEGGLTQATEVNPSDLLSANLDERFIADLGSKTHFLFSVQDVFHYIYAILYSPAYRSRYAEFLKIDFPRIPLTNDVELFRKLCAKGADLVALHLLEDEYEAASWNQQKKQSPLKKFITQFTSNGPAEVAKGYPKYQQGSVFINPSRAFEGVPEEVWNFHIGGYQVCEKWLKDRRGRTLSQEDILHYQRVVVALKETIRLMAEIDEVIEAHGGWPLAGSQDTPKVEQDQSSLPFA